MADEVKAQETPAEDVQDVKAENDVKAEPNETPEPEQKIDKEGDGHDEADVGFKASDIELPKDMKYDEETANKFEALVAQHGISKEAANELAKMYFGLIGKTLADTNAGYEAAKAAAAEAQEKEDAEWIERQRAEFMDACKADRELGGQRWNKTCANVKRAIDTLKADGFVQTMQGMGIDNHPEVIRLLAKVGDMLSEDTIFGGRSAGGRMSDAEVFYGHNAN